MFMIRTVVLLLITLVGGLASAAGNFQNSIETAAFIPPQGHGAPVTMGSFEVETPAALTALESLLAQQNPETRVIFTTDNEELYRAYISSESGSQSRGAIRLGYLFQNTQIEPNNQEPIAEDDLFRRPQGVTELLSRYQNFARDSWKKDKTGFLLNVIVTGMDVYFWIHSASYTPLVTSAQILITVAQAVTFGINKPLWGNTAHFIGQKAEVFLKRAWGMRRLSSEKRAAVMDAIGDYSITISIVATRAALVTFGTTQGDASIGYLLGKMAITTVLLSMAHSFANVGWEQWIANLDKLEGYPKAKFLANRWKELRGLILEYGMNNPRLLALHPIAIATVIASGVSGLAAWASVKFTAGTLDKFANWVGEYKNLRLFMKGPRCASIFH